MGNRSAAPSRCAYQHGHVLLVTQCTYAPGHTRDAAFFTGRAFRQRQIRLATFEVAPGIGALVSTRVEPQEGCERENGLNPVSSAVGGKILGHAEPDRAFVARPRHHVAGLLRRATTAVAHRKAARSPASVGVVLAVAGSSSGWPKSSSSRLICWLTVDWVR